MTVEAYEAGYYEKLYNGLRRWVSEVYPFTDPCWSNREIPVPHG